jgi:microcystin-dependent protein
MKKLLLSTLLIMVVSISYSQVGIGNVSPNNNSILDLSNNNQRGLMLPKGLGILPIDSTDTAGLEGLLYFSDDDSVIYYNEGGAYNGLSPWRYKFGSSVLDDTYFIKSGNVGIGLSLPKKKLHVKDDGEIVVIEGDSSGYLSFHIKGEKAGRLGFDTASSIIMTLANEIPHGDIDIKTSGSGAVNIPNGNVDIQDGNVDIQNGKIKEYGNELLPSGAIIMWSGDSIPAGWTLCDGVNKARLGGGVDHEVPDLRGRFIVGKDSRDADYISIGEDGGEKEVTLTKSQMPSHKHEPGNLGTEKDGDHFHKTEFTLGSSTGGTFTLAAAGEMMKVQLTTEEGGIHAHKVTLGETAGTGGNMPHENRPPYYTLAYIFKL